MSGGSVSVPLVGQLVVPLVGKLVVPLVGQLLLKIGKMFLLACCPGTMRPWNGNLVAMGTF